MSIFERAARQKLRFETSKGNMTVEDLWDLQLTSERGLSIDTIAIALNRQLKESQTESFVTDTTKVNEALQLRFDIAKHILDVKKAENATAKEAANKKVRKQQLLEIYEKKANAALEGHSLEDLQKMIDAL